MTLVAGYYVYLAESVEGHCNEQAVAIMLLVSRAEYPAQSEVRKYLSGQSSQNWFPWLSQARTTAQREANLRPCTAFLRGLGRSFVGTFVAAAPSTLGSHLLSRHTTPPVGESRIRVVRQVARASAQ